MQRLLFLFLLATIFLVLVGECKPQLDNASSTNKSQKNFYFRPQHQSGKQKNSAHMIKNRNAAAIAASSKHYKQKQQGKRLDNGLVPAVTTMTTQQQEAAPAPYGGGNSHHHHPIQVNVTAKVGETVILACTINSAGYNGLNPGVIWMQGALGNVLTLNTNRITVDQRFEIVQQPLAAQHFHMTHRERPSAAPPPPPTPSQPDGVEADDDNNQAVMQQKQQFNNDLTNFYHLKITNVQLYDENEYACETSITKRSEDQPSLHSLVYLHVTQSPSFIETLTSESNQAAGEYTDVVLKCFAVGKPLPKIRWYEIDESNGSIKDLNHEATSLTIRNISKSDNSKYECVASNGILPSVSKKFTITVYYAPIVKPVLQKTNQYMEQTVALGCVINSNPESSVSWFRQLNVVVAANRTLTPNAIFEPIEAVIGSATNSAGQQMKYQIHKYKQANQTVSYLKIKISEPSDYTKYKCEASNSIGKSETIIELLELKEPLVTSRNRYRLNKTPKTTTLDSNEESDDGDEDGELLEGSSNGNGPNELFINLGSGRDRSATAVGGGGDNSILTVDNEYQLVGGGGSSTRKKPPPPAASAAKMGNLVSGGKNRTLYKYHVSKTNRIVSSSSGQDDAAEPVESGDDDDDDGNDISDDSEPNTNRLNS